MTHPERTRMLVLAISSYSSVSHVCSSAVLHPSLYPPLLCFAFLCRYIVRANEKQAVFTGKQQRDGVSIMAFIVAGLFGAEGCEDAGRAFAAEHEAERAAAEEFNNAEGYEADGDDVAAKVGKNFVFDWPAYHQVWGDTPVHVAVTSMFAEYAVLYTRIAGRTTSAKPPPMTLTEGVGIGEQAKASVNKLVTPILGHIASVKMHKLLCHIADVIKWHANVQNCNTAVNESEHKAKKPYYTRTNKDARTFTRQLVVHAHGARGILSRHSKEDAAASAAWEAERDRRGLQQRAATADAAARDDRASTAAATRAAAATPAGATTLQDDATAVNGAPAAAASLRGTGLDSGRQALEAERLRKKRMYNISNVMVGDLARRPDLANVGALLRMSSSRKVRVATRTPIQARFECGTHVQQMLRAAEDYLGAP